MKEMTLRLQSPFRLQVVGGSMSGKSSFAAEIILHKNEIITEVPSVILYCAQYSSSIPPSIKHLVQFHQGIPDQNFIENYCKNNKSILVLLDDLQTTAMENELTTNLFLFGRHKNISVILLLHNLFCKQRNARDLSLNSSYICLLHTARDPSQILTLSRQVRPLEPNAIATIYFKYITEPYSYLLIDFNVNTPYYLRLRTNIFSQHTTIFLTENDLKNIKNSEENSNVLLIENL